MKENKIWDKTKKGKEVIKIVYSIGKFKKKYPKKSSQALAFLGIYDDKAVLRLLRKIAKGTKYVKNVKELEKLKRQIKNFYNKFDDDVDNLYQEEVSTILKTKKYKRRLKYPESFYEHWGNKMEDFILDKIKDGK